MLAEIQQITHVCRSRNRTRGSGFRLLRWLNEESIDVLISARPHVNRLVWCLRVTQLVGTPWILTIHNDLKTRLEHGDDVSGRVRTRVKTMSERWVVKKADVIVAVSQGAARRVEEFLGLESSEVYSIYNPVWSPRDAANCSQYDHPWLHPNRTWKTLVSVGRLVPEKDYETLLKAFAMVCSQRDVRMIICGDGPSREVLEKLAHDLDCSHLVDFRGFVRHPFRLSGRGDLFVLSSKSEGFGIVLVEALAAGMPIVATDCPSGPREILAGGEFGLLVPPGDALAFSKGILAALERDRDPAELRRRATVFSERAAADAYFRLGLRLLDGGESQTKPGATPK